MLTSYPPYQNFPTLTSDEIILRQITHADAHELMEISYYDGQQAGNPAEAIEMLNKINLDYLQGDSIHWGVIEVQSARLVGTCGYYRGFLNHTGELGYILKPSFEGKGLMAKALEKAIEFGIKTIGLQKVIAITDTGNIKSQNVLRKLNFLKEAEHDQSITFTYPIMPVAYDPTSSIHRGAIHLRL